MNYVYPNNETSSQIRKETNERMYDRNIPSQMLQPYIDVRPVMTKYSYFPVVDPRKQLNVKLQQQPTYNLNKIFNTGNTQSPRSGYATKVNLESELRNQVFALQKCSQSVYVPSSQSDLYSYSFQPAQPLNNQHMFLFQEEQFGSFNPNPDDKLVGTGLFHNPTRVQIRDIQK